MKKNLILGIVIVAVIVMAALYAGNTVKENNTENYIAESLNTEAIPNQNLKFGLPVDSFILEEGTIKRNENLSDIMLKKDISYQTIDEIARKSEPVFDVRKIKQGNNYYFFLSNDSLRKVDYFVYEIDNTDYIVYDLRDNIKIYRGQKPIIKQMKTAMGTIQSSLWETMVDNDINPLLAIELSEIYAWTIDFFGIQKGDNFKVIYDESFVDSVSIGISDIQACCFQHMGVDFWAFRYEQDSTFSYYNEKGESLKKAFLKAPLNYSRISSSFSYGRMHPILKIVRPHLGVDYAARLGTPVVSIGDGVVTRKGYQADGGGNYLYIKHNSVYTTSYMHLNGYATGMVVGTRVTQGQVIGYVGKTGLATGPHLDFRVYKNGDPIDPLKVEAPPVEPVKEENMETFTLVKDSYIKNINKIGVTNPNGIMEGELLTDTSFSLPELNLQ